MTKTLCAFVHEYVEGLAWAFLLSEDSCLKVHLEYFNLWKWVGGDTQRPMLLKDKFMSQFSKRRTPHYTLPLGRSKGARRLGQESDAGGGGNHKTILLGLLWPIQCKVGQANDSGLTHGLTFGKWRSEAQ